MVVAMSSHEWKPDVLAEWPRWREELIYRLRRQGKDGRQVGEVLKEADAHLRESGESPESAFGDPAIYAASRVTDPHPVGWTDPGTLAELAMSLIGGGIMIWSAILLALHRSLPLGPHPYVGTLSGLLILFLTYRQTQRDNVTDPATGRPMLGTRRQHEIRLFIVIAIATALMMLIPHLISLIGAIP